MSRLARTMSTLSSLAKASTLPAALHPDPLIPSAETALTNKDNICRTPRILQDGCFSWSVPEERKRYKYVTLAEPALALLGLQREETESDQYRRLVSGQIYTDPSFAEHLPVPYAQAYAGWQFGQFAGQLGDGRVHNLFEVDKPAAPTSALPSDKFNRKAYEVQLKGLGKTPYSRFADGKAVLRSSVREYIISEHLNAIGLPSTRALALSYFPQTYAQRQGAEKCAVVTRFAELWVRLGSFDLHRWRHDVRALKQLLDYVIDTLFSEPTKFPFFHELLSLNPALMDLVDKSITPFTKYEQMYYEIIIRNATTAAMSLCYGFLNGVLNTDNTSVLGLCMDFGPFAIMDVFNRNFTPNSEDHSLRYSYANSPTALWWNLTRLGEDLVHLLGAGPNLVNDDRLLNLSYDKDEEEQIILRATRIIEFGGELFKYAYSRQYVETFSKRIGLAHTNNADPDKQIEVLITPMLDMLEKLKCDFNLFYVRLQNADFTSPSFDIEAWARLLIPAESDGRYTDDELVTIVSEWFGEYQRVVKDTGLKRELSASANPLFLPRNWILDEVIQTLQDSECEDLSYLNKLERMAFYPFEPSKWGDDLKDVEKKWMVQGDAGEDLTMLQCSCSS